MPAKQNKLTNLRLRVISLEKQMAALDQQIGLLLRTLASHQVILKEMAKGN